MKSLLMKIWNSDSLLKRLGCLLYNVFGMNRLGLHKNILSGYSHSLLRHVKIKNKYSNNRIVIEDNCFLKNCTFHFFGSNNSVYIESNCYLVDMDIWMEEDGNTVRIGKHTAIYGKTQLACLEGTNITIGKECMFSSDICFRTGDSHSVTDLSGNRINPSRDINIGNHVWIGQKCFLNKGSCIPDDCIVGACAVVTKAFAQTNSVIAGNPARIVKENINWKRKRL